MNRRRLLALLGLGSATIAGASVGGSGSAASGAGRPAAAPPPAKLPFAPVPLPIPLPGEGLSPQEQRRRYGEVILEDRLVVPEGYRAELLAVWGDPLADGHVGFNNDYLAFTPLDERQALLTVNFEYISLRPWGEGVAEATGQALPLQDLIARLEPLGGRVEVNALAPQDPLRSLVREIAAAALTDLGIGVAELQRDGEGRWRHRPGALDRRITGLSGLEDPRRALRMSGPAAAVLRARERLGHDDGLGERIIGTFANCAGGTTPWGTVLSAEENVQDQVCEAVFADGSSPSPSRCPFVCDGRRLEGLGNPFGLAGNKYGWMVELDPREPSRPAVKHSALGRFRHEAVAVRAEDGRPLIVYSGCDRHGGHLYRYVSRELVRDRRDPANSALFEAGRLEAAHFAADGSGRWIPLRPDTPVDPIRPSHFEAFGIRQATFVPQRDRTRAGAGALADDGAVAAYRRRFPRLGDLYRPAGPEDGTEAERQLGAILIDAHLAANAAGATPTARPEDTVLDPRSGDLFIAFTAAGADAGGRADPEIFAGPAGQTAWPHGWIVRLSDDPGGDTFRWRMEAVGGLPWEGGLGFSNPDNLAVDRRGNLWMVTDRSSGSEALEVFGPNSCWLLPRGGAGGRDALCFATGPMECELTGPCFDADERTLFLSVQHPGEVHGTHHAGEEVLRVHRLVDADGETFEQQRRRPLGSNWPSPLPGRSSPRPGIVAIRRLDGEPLLGS